MRSLLLALCLTIALAGGAHAQSPVRDAMIVPGMRVGPMALGMNAIELAAAMGSPGEVLRQDKTTVYSWGELSAEIGETSPGVDLITVNDSRYETAGHIHVGLAAPLVAAVMGDPLTKTTQLGLEIFDYDGMSVVAQNNLVVQIRVRK